jgi:hypothetical protein
VVAPNEELTKRNKKIIFNQLILRQYFSIWNFPSFCPQKSDLKEAKEPRIIAKAKTTSFKHDIAIANSGYRYSRTKSSPQTCFICCVANIFFQASRVHLSILSPGQVLKVSLGSIGGKRPCI